MKKLVSLFVFALAFTLNLPASSSTSVRGWITDTMCAANGKKTAHADCARKCAEKGAKLAIVTDGDGKLWTISNPDSIKGHEGHYVQVTGTPDAEKNTIEIAEVKMLEQPAGEKGAEHKH